MPKIKILKNKIAVTRSKIDQPTPTSADDFDVRLVRSGKSKSDKDFLMDDPRFSEEAMTNRRQQQMIKIRKQTKKDLLKRFGK